MNSGLIVSLYCVQVLVVVAGLVLGGWAFLAHRRLAAARRDAAHALTLAAEATQITRATVLEFAALFPDRYELLYDTEGRVTGVRSRVPVKETP